MSRSWIPQQQTNKTMKTRDVGRGATPSMSKVYREDQINWLKKYGPFDAILGSEDWPFEAFADRESQSVPPHLESPRL
eukprot:6473380-Amphidinium_carterae.1